MNLNFAPIHMADWPRREVFYYFSKMAPTGYSITAEADVTGLRAALKARGLKFFPAYLWLTTKCLNRQPEFRLAYRGDVLGTYETLTPLYASFHPDDETFSLMWTEYAEDFFDFHRAYCDNQARYGETHGILCQPVPPPENAYTVSCIPWMSFRHFAVHSYENKPYFFPSVEAGKLEVRDGRELLPLSLTCHHAAADGIHVHRFFRQLEAEAEALRALLTARTGTFRQTAQFIHLKT